jgi:3-methylcrotonyl-CoA carboxylase alpha subunit
VPVTPGYLGDNQDPGACWPRPRKIGYPVLIKAVAGGGGKGMRLVDDAAKTLPTRSPAASARRRSFGNDHVLIEKYILSPRHIEVQVFGDSHGNVVHLFERDCSLQRRHQKVIEEAPAPGMDAGHPRRRSAPPRCARPRRWTIRARARSNSSPTASEGLRADRIWFMEMNTRLQVEHPVTEEITGVDLVEWQLRVAAAANCRCSAASSNGSGGRPGEGVFAEYWKT